MIGHFPKNEKKFELTVPQFSDDQFIKHFRVPYGKNKFLENNFDIFMGFEQRSCWVQHVIYFLSNMSVISTVCRSIFSIGYCFKLNTTFFTMPY